MMFCLKSVLCLCGIVIAVSGSAIPMWEFLSKEEKTSYIYSLFANQVENYCDTSSTPNCNQILLKYGLGNLKNMPEEQLDSMDPYQRNANKIIWESMLIGHPLMKSTPKPKPTTTAKPNSYDDDSDVLDFGSESAASAKIDNVYVVLPPKGFTYNDKSQHTVRFDNIASFLNAYNQPEQKGVFRRFQEQHPVVSTTTDRSKIGRQNEDKLRRKTSDTSGENIPIGTYLDRNGKPMDDLIVEGYDTPLTGPAVVKVYPDGTPVRESTETPQDEDLRQYKLSKTKIPSL